MTCHADSLCDLIAQSISQRWHGTWQHGFAFALALFGGERSCRNRGGGYGGGYGDENMVPLEGVDQCKSRLRHTIHAGSMQKHAPQSTNLLACAALHHSSHATDHCTRLQRTQPSTALRCGPAPMARALHGSTCSPLRRQARCRQQRSTRK